jgi:hypothetical protein
VPRTDPPGRTNIRNVVKSDDIDGEFVVR